MGSSSPPHILPYPGAVGGHEGLFVECQAWVCCRSAMGVGGRVGGSCGRPEYNDRGREKAKRTREASVDVAAAGEGVRPGLSLPSSSRSPALIPPCLLPPFLLPSSRRAMAEGRGAVTS